VFEREDDEPPYGWDDADPFDTPAFARTYVVTCVVRVVGAVAFVGGCGLAFLTRSLGGVFVVVGAAALVVGSVVSGVSAYRVLRSRGFGRYTAWTHSRPWSSPSLNRYRRYRERLRGLSSPPA
jgi:hypothetical protein